MLEMFVFASVQKCGLFSEDDLIIGTETALCFGLPVLHYIKRSFYQDRLGTNMGKVEGEKGGRFVQSRWARTRRL